MASPDYSGKKSNFMSRTVVAVQDFLAARNALLALYNEWNAVGYGVSGAYQITQNDIVGANSQLTPTALAAIFTSQQNLETMLAQGNLTNFEQAVP